MKPYNKALKQHSRNLRNSMTEAEQLLWSRLRRKQVLDVQFYRQKPLGGYIVDFYCAATNLVIEVDGSQHFEEQNKQSDQQRTAKLTQQGLVVMRFDNRQVLTEIDAVMEEIYLMVKQKIPPSPSRPTKVL